MDYVDMTISRMTRQMTLAAREKNPFIEISNPADAVSSTLSARPVSLRA
jgi:hypothetical protein